MLVYSVFVFLIYKNTDEGCTIKMISRDYCIGIYCNMLWYLIDFKIIIQTTSHNMSHNSGNLLMGNTHDRLLPHTVIITCGTISVMVL